MSYRQPVRAQSLGPVNPAPIVASHAGGISIVRTFLPVPAGSITQVCSRGKTLVRGWPTLPAAFAAPNNVALLQLTSCTPLRAGGVGAGVGRLLTHESVCARPGAAKNMEKAEERMKIAIFAGRTSFGQRGVFIVPPRLLCPAPPLRPWSAPEALTDSTPRDRQRRTRHAINYHALTGKTMELYLNGAHTLIGAPARLPTPQTLEGAPASVAFAVPISTATNSAQATQGSVSAQRRVSCTI